MTSRQHQKRFVCSISILYLALYLQPLLDRNKEWDFVKIWDDEENFLLNPAIQGISWEQVKEMVLLKKINVYEPIGWIIKAIVIHYYGMNSWAIRVVTVSFHVAACFLLILNSSKLLRLLDTIDARGSKNNNYLLGCIMSGLLYTIHPLIIEVVAWPSAQPYAVAMFFSMLSMYFNLYVHDHGAKMGLLQEMGYNFLSSFFYLCAVLSKSVSILLPSAVFLLDTVLLWTSNGNWKACIETIRKCTNRQVLAYGFTRGLYLVVLGIFLFITLDTNAAGTHIDADVHFLTLAERLTNFFMLPMWMFQHFMWPIGLRPHYQIHSGDLDLFTNSTSLLSFGYFLVLLGASIYLWYQESPKHFAALLYFLIMLFPTSGIIQHGLVSFTSDRYFYFPGILVVPYLGYFFHQIFEPTLAHQDIHSTMDSSITSSQKPKLNKTKKVQSIPSDTVATTSKTHPCPSYVTKFPIYLFLSVMLIISRRQVNIWVDSYSLLEHSVR
jgi:hypothetical protein